MSKQKAEVSVESRKMFAEFPKLPTLKSQKRIAIILLSLLLFSISLLLTAWLLLLERFYPGTSIADVNVSFLTKAEAEQKITKVLLERTKQPITFSYQNNQKQIQITPQMITSVVPNTVTQAFAFGHTSWEPTQRHSKIDLNQDKDLAAALTVLESQINEPPIDSQLRIEVDQINVTPSQDGQMINRQEVKDQINLLLNNGKLKSNRLPVQKISPKLTYQTALEIKKRLDQIRITPIQLTFKEKVFYLDLPTIMEMIDLNNSDTHLLSANFGNTQTTVSSIRIGNETISDAKLLINHERAINYFKTIAQQIDQEVQEPLFAFDPTASETSKVKEFKPPVEGQKLQLEQSVEKISQLLLNPNQNTLELPVSIVSPTNKLSNELGIKELVATGYSSYSGSIENRIYNVSHGASKINGVIIPPGEVFSFNKTVGDITAATGFKQAYVIKSGRTVLDDGGGICQVSTTLFRAALNAGLPIVERAAHAYRVGYYEQGFSPGIDATIFYPSVDFKFKNDTPNHLLIQTTIVGTNLTIDLYGTKDGRTVELTKPIISSQTPAPPELRQDDPTLPKGTVKQVDWAAAGANVSFKRIVKKDGVEIINETFKSNYRPWQAVYLVGTKEG